MTERQYYNIIYKGWEETSTLFGNDGKEWYSKAREYADELAVKYSLNIAQTSGILASLSPMKSWTENKRLANEFLKGNERGHFKQQINKARNIKYVQEPDRIDKILNGAKTVSFFRHMYTPWDNNYCVIDNHMIKLFNNGILQYITPRRYEKMSNAVKKLANHVNMNVSEVQGILWLKSKDLYGINV